MNQADKYIRELDKIVGKTRGLSVREAFKFLYSSGYEGLAGKADKYYKYLEMSDSEARAHEPEIRAVAKSLMEEGNGELGHEANIFAAFHGAKLYEKVGKGKNAIPKLLDTARKDKSNVAACYRSLRKFIEKNAGNGRERQSSPSGLEGRTAVFLLSTLAGISISVFSFNATGNAVAGVTGTSQGLLGIFLFIFGLAGIFFKGKK